MSWGNPMALHLLWLAPVLALLLGWAWRSRRAALQALGPVAAERVSARALRVHGWRLGMWWLAMVLGVVALAQPRWGWRWQELKREGLDLVVLLDVSRSMDAADVSPSRMERARREVLDLVELLAGDRVALVIFAGGAYPRMPLTLDYGVLRHVVRDSATESLVAQGSDLGAALQTGLALLGRKGKSDRAMLLITDGEDHEGRAREVAAQVAEADVHLYVIGVGTVEGAPIPQAGGGFKKDAEGRMVLSRLDEDLLTDIARAGAGAYVRSGGGNQDVRAIYEDEIRGRLQGAEEGVRREKIWDERYQWPLGLAVLLLMGSSLVRPGRLQIPGAMASALLLVLAMPARAQDDPVAAIADQQAGDPDDPALAERLGAALHQAGRFNEANEVYTGLADRALDTDQRQRARYNAGLAAYRSGRLTRAMEDWQRLLQEQPEGAVAEQAQKNLQLVQQELAKRTGQEPPPQDGDQQGDQQQDGEDGEPQDGEPGEPQDGEPQDGGEPGEPPDPSDGTMEPEDGEPTEEPVPGEAGDFERDGAKEPPSDGTNDAEATGGDEADTGTPQAAGEPGEGEAPQRPGSIASAEAEKMLDSVQEGSPRVRAQRRPAGEKDW